MQAPNPFLEFCFSNPAFPSLPTYYCTSLSKYLTLWKFQSIALEPKILWKRWFAWSFPKFVCTFSFVMPFSYESEHTKLMTLLIINLSLEVFYRQSLSCEVINKSQGDLNSSNSKYFPLCPPWSISVALLLFEASTSIFCVLIRPLHSLHTVCFRIFAVPVVWSILATAVLRPPRLVSIVQSFLKASSSISRVRIRPLRLLRIICFRNFSQHAHAPPLKSPAARRWKLGILDSWISYWLLLFIKVVYYILLRSLQYW